MTPRAAAEFLRRRRKGKPDSKFFERAADGFLQGKMDGEGNLQNLAFVRGRGQRAFGPQLYFNLLGKSVTFKTPRSLSGLEWSNGKASYGTVYDDSAGKPMKISLSKWLSACITQMTRKQ